MKSQRKELLEKLARLGGSDEDVIEWFDAFRALGELDNPDLIKTLDMLDNLKSLSSYKVDHSGVPGELEIYPSHKLDFGMQPYSTG